MSKSTAGSASPKPILHYGRGGAGNVTSKEHVSPKVQARQTTPTLKGNIYPTGRGGTGNMAKNDFGEEARVAQDVDVPSITLAEGEHHTGRGGAANTYKPSASETQHAKAHNQSVRRESFNKIRAKDGALKAVVEKSKEALSGKK